MDTLSYMVESSLVIEKLRVASEVRQSHLKRNGRNDKDTDDLHQRIQGLEDYVDARVATLIKDHPAYPWFSRVKGIGKENIGKIVGLVRVKPSDEFICPNKECRIRIIKNGLTVSPLCPECETQMIDPPYADTISSLWKFAGYDVGEDGKAPKRRTGTKLSYNSQLRSMCWRVGVSLMRSQGKFYEYYTKQKSRYIEVCNNTGVQIVPASKLPKKDGKAYEPDNMISEGHLHNRALRKVIKLFLACLWLEWRKAEGLPLTMPYSIDVLKHDTFIKPEEMTDR